MSTIKTETLSTPSNSTVPVDTVVNGTAKAWVNFNGTGTVAIRRAFNVSSITDNGAGNYTVNFTNAMPDSNYSIAGSALGNIQYLIMSPYTAISTTQCQVIVSNTAALADNSVISVVIFS